MNLNGWHTAFAIPISHANASLAESSLKEFPTFNSVDGNIKVFGNFDGWRIVPGGSGQLLHVKLPIKSGTLSGLGPESDLAGLAVTVEVSLKFLPPESNASKNDLRFNLKKTAKPNGDAVAGGDKSADEGLVTGLSVEDPNKRLSFTQSAYLRGLIPQCLVANAERITYVFAAVNLTESASHPWLTPRDAGYVYADGEDNQGSLTVLNVIEGGPRVDASKLPRQVDLGKQSNDAVFAISSDLVVRNLLMRTLQEAVQRRPYPIDRLIEKQGYGLPRFDSNNHNIFAEHFALPMVGTDQPTVDHLKISLVDQGLHSDARNGKILIGMGEGGTVYFEVKATSKFSFDAAANAISFQPDLNPQVTHRESGLVSLVEELISGVKDHITNMIADAVKQSPIVVNKLPAAVEWFGGKQFKISDASLGTDVFSMRGAFS